MIRNKARWMTILILFMITMDHSDFVYDEFRNSLTQSIIEWEREIEEREREKERERENNKKR